MCGIAGIVTRRHADVVVPMTRAIAHRGPDGEGFFRDERVALGHRRLSIVDLAGGAQPIGNEDDSLQLVANGEIYNFPEIRPQLESVGHVFCTDTDVEVILHLYEEHGPDCVRHLRGMFAFALWDGRTQSLLLARDHLGQKPLFMARVGEDLLFASEVKAILASGQIEAEPDLEALWHYMSLRFIPDQRTLFRGIDKLPAASYAVFRDGRLQVTRYWDPDYRQKMSGDVREITDGLDDLLQQTVRMHLMSDVRVGAFLSGGIDSSLVAAMAAPASAGPLPTFSIGVQEQEFNELPYARMVAEQYGLEGHERIVRADLIHMMPSMIWHLDEPSDPFGVGIYLVAETAAEHVKVVLSGDGGDENFAGYDRFAGQRLAELYAVLPDFVRRHFMTRLVAMVPESFGYKSLAQKVAWLNDMSFYRAGDRYAQSMSFLRFTTAAKERLFTADARQRIGDDDSVAKILCWFESERVDELVDRMLYTDLMTRMPDHLLAIVDRMSMAHSLETRPPLIDYRVVEFAAGIPADMKLKGRDLKHILKKVAARYLPRELIEREKQGFGFPLGLWMRKELAPFLRQLFAESRFVERGWFERAEMERLLDEHVSGKANHDFRLWILLNLEFWYRLYFEGATPDSLRETTDRLMGSKPTTVTA